MAGYVCVFFDSQFPAVNASSSLANPVSSFLQNGLGAFILQCRKLDFHYCDWAGSSRGMK